MFHLILTHQRRHMCYSRKTCWQWPLRNRRSMYMYFRIPSPDSHHFLSFRQIRAHTDMCCCSIWNCSWRSCSHPAKRRSYRRCLLHMWSRRRSHHICTWKCFFIIVGFRVKCVIPVRFWFCIYHYQGVKGTYPSPHIHVPFWQTVFDSPFVQYRSESHDVSPRTTVISKKGFDGQMFLQHVKMLI